MRTIMPFSIILLTLISHKNDCLSQNVITHPVPVEFVSSHFRVTANGQPVQVFHASMNVFFASFDFTGKVDMKITRTSTRFLEEKSIDKRFIGQVPYLHEDPIAGAAFWDGNAIVRPLSDKIQCRTEGADVSFTIAEPGQYTVERPGTSNFDDPVLLIFANRPETGRLKPDDPGVIYLKRGVHIMNAELKSNQTLYLEPGAVLFGSIDIWDAKNVKISGRGTVVHYGPQSEWLDNGYMHRKKWHPITTDNVEGLSVSGVTIVGKSRTWTIQMRTTFDAIFDNVKVIGANEANVNGDGFDWQGGGRAKVTNSFVRCCDDCFAFFTFNPKDGLPEGATPGPEDIKRSTEVKDVLIENCVLWSTLANVYRVGFGEQPLKTENIVMRNCDVIHIARGFWVAPWSVICTMHTGKTGKAVHSGYLFENVRFEEPIPLLGIVNSTTKWKDIVFKDITMSGTPDSSVVDCIIEGLTFDNVRVNGKSVLKPADLPIIIKTKQISGLNFK